MARKLKGFSIKGFFADHSEKLAFVIVLGMVALGLASTNWVPYQRQPSEFLTKVDQAKANIAKATWPEEEREKFVLQEDEQPHRIVDMGINDRIQVMPYYLQSQPQWKDKDARDDPLQEPDFLPVVDMEVSDARVLIRLAPKFDDELLAANDGAQTGNGISGSGSGSLSQAEEERPDEFLGTGRGGGIGPGPTAGSDMLAFSSFGRGRSDRDYASMAAPELMRGATAASGRGRSSRSRGGPRGASVQAADMDDLPGSRRGRSRGRTRGRGRDIAGPGDELLGPRGVMAADDEGTVGMYGGVEEDGKGYPFVSVRGVFEFREQIRLYTDAIHKTYGEALQHFMIVDFQLERQRLLNSPDQWTDWEPVNDQVFRDILNQAYGFDPEVVDPAVTDAAITCPLPSRLTGIYSKQATHSRLQEYSLTPEQMEREIEYQKLLLKNVIEQNKPPEGLIVKRGFADMVFDARSVSQSVFGTASPYAGLAMGGPAGRFAGNDEEDYGGFGGGALRTMGRGAAMGGARGLPGQAQPDPMLAKTIDQLAKEMAEREGGVESQQSVDDLKKWIQARVMPQGDLLLFRYFDFDVEPGQTYRYRVRLELQNPNYGAPLAATGGVASVIDGKTRLTPWSEPTAPIRVNETVNYFLTGVQPPRSLVHPQARMNIYQYDLDVGTVVQQELDVAMGQNVGGKARTEQADPAKGVVDNVDYTFKSNDLLIDVIPDFRFSRTDHPDLQLPTDSRGLAQIAEIAAVVTPHGEIKTVDPITQKGSFEQAKKYKEYQDEQFAHLQNLNEPVSGTAGGYGYADDEDEDMMVNMMMMRDAGRGTNPLRRGGGGKSRR